MVRKIIEDRGTIEAIVRKAPVCRIALCDDGQPYVVPVCFGYRFGDDGDVLYFHSSRKGRKLDVLRKNHAVCFEVDVDHEFVRSPNACEWSIKYRSVIGFGRASLVEDLEEKRRALDAIMAHYSNQAYEYPEATLSRTTVVKVEIERMTAKVAGY